MAKKQGRDQLCIIIFDDDSGYMANYTANEAWPGTVRVRGPNESVALFTAAQARKAIRITTLRAKLLAACNMTNDVEEFISTPKCIKIVPTDHSIDANNAALES